MSWKEFLWSKYQAWLAAPPRHEDRILSMLLILATAGLGYYYFVAYETSGHFRRDAPKFYHQIVNDFPGWMRLTSGEVRHALKTGDVNEFDSYVLRALLVRWRHRNISEQLFENLLADYEKGWWLSPESEQWREMLQTHDQQWLALRKRSIDTIALEQLQSQIALQTRGEDGFTRVSFAKGVKTHHLGSRLQMRMRLPEGQVASRIGVYWGTNKEGYVAWQFRRTSVTRVPGAPEGFVDYLHRLDFSWEPAWMALEAAPKFIDFRQAIDPKTIQSIGFDDSPLLRL